MARIIREKKLINSRTLKPYASWIYCEKCNNTVAYLCYSEYNNFDFSFDCECGTSGKVFLSLESDNEYIGTDEQLTLIKNRYCCSNDKKPLFSIVHKNVKRYNGKICCECCKKRFNFKGENMNK